MSLLRQACRLLRRGQCVAGRDGHEWDTLAEWTARAPADITGEPTFERDLESEIIAFLAAVGIATAEEIARGIQAQTYPVRHLLAAGDPFTRVEDPRAYGRSPKAKLYMLSETFAADGWETAEPEAVAVETGQDGLGVDALLADEDQLRATVDYLSRFDLAAYLAGGGPWPEPGDESEPAWPS